MSAAIGMEVPAPLLQHAGYEELQPVPEEAMGQLEPSAQCLSFPKADREPKVMGT